MPSRNEDAKKKYRSLKPIEMKKKKDEK